MLILLLPKKIRIQRPDKSACLSAESEKAWLYFIYFLFLRDITAPEASAEMIRSAAVGSAVAADAVSSAAALVPVVFGY